MAYRQYSAFYIRGCLFDGKFIGSTTSSWGGFVGWRQSGNVYIYQSIFAPTGVTIKNSESATFCRNDAQSSYTRCYYTWDINDGTHYTGQGHRLRSITPGPKVTVGLSGYATNYSVSGITNYGDVYQAHPGLQYGDTYYAGSGEAVSITLSPTSPAYIVISYSVSNGGTLSGNATDGWTLTMPDASVTVTATLYDLTLFGYNEDPLVDGSAAHPYIITTAAGWNQFCDALEDNTTWNRFIGKTVKLGNSFSVTRTAGSSGHDFCGTFDGQHNTLIVSLSGAQYVAPFFYVKSQDDDHPATIQNLVVDGTVTASGKFAAGIAGGCAGKVNITNCLVRTTISSSVPGDGTHGGLVGVFDGGTLNITGCAFTGVDGATIRNLVVGGSITDTGYRAAGIIGETSENLSHITNCMSSVNISGNRYTAGFSVGGNVAIEGCVFNGKIVGREYSGGFVGWSYSGLAITNCLFAPQDGSSISGGTFYYNSGGGDITPINSYYTTALGTPQGAIALTTATLPANIGTAGTAYSVSGITPYTSGLKYGGLYYMTPEAVSLADDAANDVTSINSYFADVQLQGRTLYKDGKWNTLCLPFSLTAEQIAAHTDFAGATLMELDTEGKNGFDATDGTLWLTFKTATEIAAGVPYIVKWDKAADYDSHPSDYDITSPTFSGVTINAAASTTVSDADEGLEPVQMVGCYSPVSVTADDKSILYLGKANTLYYSSIDNDIRSCRAYFSVPYIKGNPSATARAFRLDFGDGEQTGITTTNYTNFTNDGDAWYTLDGVKLDKAPTRKGMYIKNGRKVVVK